MSIYESVARFARSAMASRSAQRTSVMLDSLPAHVQSDIGWRWAPRLRGQQKSAALGCFPGY